MLYDYMDILESIGLDLLLLLSSFHRDGNKDVLKQGNVPVLVVVLYG